MAVVLDGGCRVSTMHEGEPRVSGSLKVWDQIGKASGAKAISLRVLEFGPGTSPVLSNHDTDEVLYVLEGSCNVVIGEDEYEVGPDTGVYLRPGQTLRVENNESEVVRFISSQCPAEPVKPVKLPPIVKLADRRALPTADRWYRVLVDDEIGSEQVTQFVGSIPPGRAPPLARGAAVPAGRDERGDQRPRQLAAAQRRAGRDAGDRGDRAACARRRRRVQART